MELLLKKLIKPLGSLNQTNDTNSIGSPNAGASSQQEDILLEKAKICSEQMGLGELKTLFTGRIEKVLERIFNDRRKDEFKERKLSPGDLSMMQNSMDRSRSK
jgi:hypothetical protein